MDGWRWLCCLLHDELLIIQHTKRIVHDAGAFFHSHARPTNKRRNGVVADTAAKMQLGRQGSNVIAQRKSARDNENEIETMLQRSNQQQRCRCGGSLMDGEFHSNQYRSQQQRESTTRRLLLVDCRRPNMREGFDALTKFTTQTWTMWLCGGRGSPKCYNFKGTAAWEFGGNENEISSKFSHSCSVL